MDSSAPVNRWQHARTFTWPLRMCVSKSTSNSAAADSEASASGRLLLRTPGPQAGAKQTDKQRGSNTYVAVRHCGILEIRLGGMLLDCPGRGSHGASRGGGTCRRRRRGAAGSCRWRRGGAAQGLAAACGGCLDSSCCFCYRWRGEALWQTAIQVSDKCCPLRCGGDRGAHRNGGASSINQGGPDRLGASPCVGASGFPPCVATSARPKPALR